MKNKIYTLNAYTEGTEVDSWFTRVSGKRDQHFANIWGADYIHLDRTPNRRPPHYHKLEVFEEFLKSDGERGLFLDMDIYIEDECPNLFAKFPDGTYMCYDYMMNMGHYYQWCQSTYGSIPQVKYDGRIPHQHDHGGRTWRYFNTGVILFDRAFAEFMLKNIVKSADDQQPENGEWVQYPDGWGEQHNINYHLDKHNYPVSCFNSRDYNELTGLSESRGRFISHYAAPWGRKRLGERELHSDQGSFQRKYLKGSILNVGCNTDYARLKEDFGAYNIDLRSNDQLTGMGYPIDEIMDARHLDPNWSRKWDTIVLGEILEHMQKEDRIKTLKEAVRCTKKNGWINITIPHDDRDVFDQHSEHTHETNSLEYTEGVSAFHAFVYTDSACREDIAEVGLEVVCHEPMQYGFHNKDTNEPVRGSCYLCVKPAHRQRLRDNNELLWATPQPEDGEKVIIPDNHAVLGEIPVDLNDLAYGNHGIDWVYASENG